MISTSTSDVGVRICPLCGSADAVTVLDRETLRGNSFHLVRCRNCSLTYTRPLPSTEELEKLYSDDFYPTGTTTMKQMRTLLHHIVLRQRYRPLSRRKPGRLLDVGCGDADYLRYMRSRGWDVHGTETSSAAIRLARLKGIEPVASASVFQTGYFDAVTLWHVIEHLPDPASELVELHRILKTDGVLVAEVPNMNSWMYSICRAEWFPLDIPRHLQHFTPKTLRMLLDKCGFTVVARRNFHLSDPALVALSLLQRAGILHHGQAGQMVENVRSMPAMRKTLLSLTTPLIVLLSTVLSPLLFVLSRNSETMTITAAPRA